MSPGGGQKVLRAAPTYRKSDDVAVLFARASTYHRFGHLAEAQVGYKKILKKRPNHFGALHMLGGCEQQSGNSVSAERFLRRAILIRNRLRLSAIWASCWPRC